MTDPKPALYFPNLRMRSGELLGLRDLAADIAEQVFPRLIIPPIGERDDSIQSQLFTEPDTPDIAQALFTHWGSRRALVEATHLISEPGKGDIATWLLGMFERAQTAGCEIIPLINLSELDFDHLKVYKTFIRQNYKTKLGIAVSAENIENDSTTKDCHRILNETECDPSQCVIIADFQSTDLSNSAIVAPIISGAVEALQKIAVWQQVIFQGASYPEVNRAPAGGSLLIPRREWTAWREAVEQDRALIKLLPFGDYAADCSKLKFDSVGGRAIRHYRYTTSEFWLNQRGDESGTHKAVMRKVCEKILDSGHFAGRDFSLADDFIFKTAKGTGGPGGAREWRAVNTTHHITRVVTDIGAMLGIGFRRQIVEREVEQATLL